MGRPSRSPGEPERGSVDRSATLTLPPRRPSSRPKLSDVLYEDILNHINAGQWAVGERLPTEWEFSQQFGVSRPIVREALERLRLEGRIYSRRGAGSFVKAPGEGAVAPPQEGLPPLRSIVDIRKLYDFRIALEGEIAHAAALHRNETTMRDIQAALARLNDAFASGQVGVTEDFGFHLAIARAAQNQYFVASLQAVEYHIRFVIDLARSLSLPEAAGRIRRVQQGHLPVIEAIRAGDAEGARAAMRTHVVRARERIFNGTDL